MNNQGKGGPWWREAAFLFSEISAWIVFPIVAALVAGKALDAKYGTSPWLFITMAAFGFLITAYGIVRSVKKYSSISKIKKEDWKMLKKIPKEDSDTEQEKKSI